jgi:hypothetical protein
MFRTLNRLSLVVVLAGAAHGPALGTLLVQTPERLAVRAALVVEAHIEAVTCHTIAPVEYCRATLFVTGTLKGTVPPGTRVALTWIVDTRSGCPQLRLEPSAQSSVWFLSERGGGAHGYLAVLPPSPELRSTIAKAVAAQQPAPSKRSSYPLHPPTDSETHRGLTPACSGLATLAADARR